MAKKKSKKNPAKIPAKVWKQRMKDHDKRVSKDDKGKNRGR